MISAMKWTKDTHDTPPADAVIDKVIAGIKSTGATNIEVATVLGRPNWLEQSKRWADRIHAFGSATWRCAHQEMEFERKSDGSITGLYGVTPAIGANRKPQQFYIDLAVQTILANPTLFKDGDEWAIYPERTEGIFNDSSSWISPNTPSAYADFYIRLADASAAAFAQIGKKVTVGLSANNASEVLSGWMPMNIMQKAGYVVVDHYVDGDSARLESDLRTMKSRTGLPIYLQESAPHRMTNPTPEMISSYFKALTRLVEDGVLQKFGSWSGWIGNPESIFNSDFTLNAHGQALKAFFTPAVLPTPTTDLKPVLDAIADLKLSVDSRVTLEKCEAIIWGAGTLSVKMAKLKELIPNT